MPHHHSVNQLHVPSSGVVRRIKYDRYEYANTSRHNDGNQSRIGRPDMTVLIVVNLYILDTLNRYR